MPNKYKVTIHAKTLLSSLEFKAMRVGYLV